MAGIPAQISSALLSDCTVSESLGYPIVTISGRAQVCIENHRGISEYENEAVTVLSGKYDIRVTGLNLTIRSMNTDTLVITGDINAVTF
ncbi:MAG: YabP/YqfC family sporulation protein [Oscillospiraceae bacterium]|jgi:sporulation protein YqfC|nr:YabP/YqfC family sporulation protein [Oscillospiraceae bacterium]